MRWSTRRRRLATSLVMLGIYTSGACVLAPTEQEEDPSSDRPSAGPETVGLAGPSVPDLASLGWVPVLDDEFHGNSLDETVWKVHEGPGSHGPGLNSRDAIDVSGGALTITTYSEDDGAGGLRHVTGGLETGAIDDRWAGFLGTYGYIEARVKLNNAPGTRSAFWMLSETFHRSPWKDPAGAGPEIDIFEMRSPEDGNEDGECSYQPVALPCEQLAISGGHWDGFDEDHAQERQLVPWTGASPQGNFVTYGLLWTPDGYRMYRDGIEVYQGSQVGAYTPEFLILEQQQGSLLGAVPPDGYGSREESTAKMVVDYVRVWQRPISDVPDQVVGSGSGGSLSVPFAVTDHFVSGPGGVADQPPGTVRVSATSSDQALVGDESIVVTGNPPDDPDGTLVNGSFEDGAAGWELSTSGGQPSAARIWSGRAHSSRRSLRLERTGGRAEQTVGGLEPNTTYILGGWYNLELEWDDVDGDGEVGADEPFDPDGAWARFDWGVADVDSSRPGNQRVELTRQRNGWQEQGEEWSPHRDDWRYDSLRFTTGPKTTSVTVYVDNTAYAGDRWGGSLSFDGLHLRPAMPPDRTVTLRSEAGAHGDTTITLTARDARGDVLGNEAFTVTVSESTFTNGGFETLPAGHGWDLRFGGTEVVVDDPFVLNRVVRLATEHNGALFQDVSGLQPNTPYTLDFRGRVEQAGGVVGVVVTDYGGPMASSEIETTEWSSRSVEFTTDDSGAARVYVLDWSTADGPSMVDDLDLRPVGSVGPGPSPPAPPLVEVGEQHVTSTTPLALPFDAAGVTIDRVTSSNQHLLPDGNLGVAVGPRGEHVLSASPLPGRTGEATMSIHYVDSSGAAVHDVRVVVSDGRLVNRGFEDGRAAWSLPSNAAVQPAVTRSGTAALRLDVPVSSGDDARQLIEGLGFNTGFVLGGWSRGDVRVTVRTVPDESQQMSPPESFTIEHSADWTSGDWTENRLRFTTPQCTDCFATGSHDVDQDGDVMVLPGARIEVSFEATNPTGEPAYLDDLYLITVPEMSPIRDLSLHQGLTQFDWNTARTVNVGGVPANGIWDPDVVEVDSSNENVLPLDNIRLVQQEGIRPHEWTIETRAHGTGVVTGRSEVTLTLTDPTTGLSNQQTFTVTVNAGDSFESGDFQQPSLSRFNGWDLSEAGWNVVDKQRWRYLAGYDSRGNLVGLSDESAVGPNDVDQVLRISSGLVGFRIEGLEPGQRYVVRANAVGDGSTLRAIRNTNSLAAWGQELGRTRVDSTAWAPTADLVFTAPANIQPADPAQPDPRDESIVWLFVWDDQFDSGVDDPACRSGQMPCDDDTMNEPVAESTRACALYAAGEACIDDIGVFRATDLS